VKFNAGPLDLLVLLDDTSLQTGLYIFRGEQSQTKKNLKPCL
jgi:hypothetical protein